LGQRATQAEHQGHSGSNEIAQNHKPTLKHPLTHKFPDLVPAQAVPAKILVDSLPEIPFDTSCRIRTRLLRLPPK
jgi:hypothetical protein